MTSATVSTIQLFECYADGIYTLGVRMLRDRHLAEDLVQDTFLKILRGSAPYRGDGSLAGWVYRIGYSGALDVEMPDEVRARIRGSLEEEQARG